mmetsp:Transcript_59800/g.141478  ORF Transcript_59800/g.141478 Transcript_59800/m.141478 type:complete len:222 (-) Transcript_59800:703-1368(-)
MTQWRSVVSTLNQVSSSMVHKFSITGNSQFCCSAISRGVEPALVLTTASGYARSSTSTVSRHGAVRKVLRLRAAWSGRHSIPSTHPVADTATGSWTMNLWSTAVAVTDWHRTRSRNGVQAALSLCVIVEGCAAAKRSAKAISSGQSPVGALCSIAETSKASGELPPASKADAKSGFLSRIREAIRNVAVLQTPRARMRWRAFCCVFGARRSVASVSRSSNW